MCVSASEFLHFLHWKNIKQKQHKKTTKQNENENENKAFEFEKACE